MSTTLSSGFDGVSNQTSRVRSVSASQSDVRPGGEVDVASRRSPCRDGRARDSGTSRHRRRRRRRSPRPVRRARRWRRSSPTPRRRRSRAPALERRDRPLEALPRRVLRAGVLVPAARPADAVLGIGRGLVDRRRDGPGQLVGFGAGMDGHASRRPGSSSLMAAGSPAAWLEGRRAGRPAVELEDELLAVDVVDLDADLRETEAPDDRQRRHVARRDRRAEPVDAVGERPIEQGMDDLGRDSLAAVSGLDAVADLDPAVGAGRGVEPARADDPARAVGLGQHDRPAEPGLRLGIDRQVRDPELQEVVERVGQVDRHDRADLVLGRLQVARNEVLHERGATSRPARSARSGSAGRPSPRPRRRGQPRASGRWAEVFEDVEPGDDADRPVAAGRDHRRCPGVDRGRRPGRGWPRRRRTGAACP